MIVVGSKAPPCCSSSSSVAARGVSFRPRRRWIPVAARASDAAADDIDDGDDDEYYGSRTTSFKQKWDRWAMMRRRWEKERTSALTQIHSDIVDLMKTVRDKDSAFVEDVKKGLCKDYKKQKHET
jgi:hypothetical protein